MKELIIAEGIYDEYINKILTKSESTKLLISLVENEDNGALRAEIINLVDKIGFKNEIVFNFLELSLVSGQDSRVRAASVEALYHIFPKECIKPLNWAIENDKSADVLRTFVKIVHNVENQSQKELYDLYGLVHKKLWEMYGVVSSEALVLLEIHELYGKNDYIDDFLRWSTKNRYVESLSIKELPYKELPKYISIFTNLKSLTINHSKISKIKGLDNLTRLKKLNLGYNNILKIKGLDNLKNLKKLNLRGNLITEINDLAELENLEMLDLAENKIPEIKGLDNLKSLKKLKLRGNLITEISDLNEMENLEVLNLAENKISEIKGLEALKNLKKLNLMKNKISEIKGLKALKNLKNLSLMENKISKFGGIYHLKNLEILDLSINQISKLDMNDIKGLEKLRNLGYLDIRLTRIPDSLLVIQELDYKSARFWNEVGVGYHESKNLTSAIKAYKRAIKLAPDCKTCLGNLGITYRDSGKYRAAFKYCKRALKADPNLNYILRFYVQLDDYKGLLKLYHNDVERLIKLLKETISSYPFLLNAKSILAQLYFNDGDYILSAEACNRTLLQDPNNKRGLEIRDKLLKSKCLC